MLTPISPLHLLLQLSFAHYSLGNDRPSEAMRQSLFPCRSRGSTADWPKHSRSQEGAVSSPACDFNTSDARNGIFFSRASSFWLPLLQVKQLRSLLGGATQSQEGAELFHSLYSSWCHSAGAVLSLCLLAGAYSHACDVITCYAHLPMGVEVLVQIDRLVQLLETPIFTYLRLQLLQPSRYPDLIR